MLYFSFGSALRYSSPTRIGPLESKHVNISSSLCLHFSVPVVALDWMIGLPQCLQIMVCIYIPCIRQDALSYALREPQRFSAIRAEMMCRRFQIEKFCGRTIPPPQGIVHVCTSCCWPLASHVAHPGLVTLPIADRTVTVHAVIKWREAHIVLYACFPERHRLYRR